MFNVIITDIDNNAYNFTCDSFTETFESTVKKQELILYSNSGDFKSFVEDFMVLDETEIKQISFIKNEANIMEYNIYSKLYSASVNCRESSQASPDGIGADIPVFQGIVIFRK